MNRTSHIMNVFGKRRAISSFLEAIEGKITIPKNDYRGLEYISIDWCINDYVTELRRYMKDDLKLKESVIKRYIDSLFDFDLVLFDENEMKFYKKTISGSSFRLFDVFYIEVRMAFNSKRTIVLAGRKVFNEGNIDFFFKDVKEFKGTGIEQRKNVREELKRALWWSTVYERRL